MQAPLGPSSPANPYLPLPARIVRIQRMTPGHHVYQLRFLDLLGNANGRLDVGDVRAWMVDQGIIPDA